MKKKSMKKVFILVGVGVAVFAVILAVLFICLVRMLNKEMQSDTVSDQYLERIIEAAEHEDRDSMRSLYLSEGLPDGTVDRQIQIMMDAFKDHSGYTYKKTGYRRRTSISGGQKNTTFISQYTVTTGRGKEIAVTLQRVERSQGESGLETCILYESEAVKSIEKMNTNVQWGITQLGLYIVSIAVIAGTIATAVICYRQHPRYRWGWIALILLLYAAPGFSFMANESGKSLSLTFYITIAGLSRYRVYPKQGIDLKLYIPAGMIIYWIVRKRLSKKNGMDGDEAEVRSW